MASTDVLYHVIIAQGIEQYIACNGAWQQNVSCAWCINLAKKRGGGTKSNQIEMKPILFSDPKAMVVITVVVIFYTFLIHFMLKVNYYYKQLWCHWQSIKQ